MGLMTKLAAQFRRKILRQRPPLSANALKGREYDDQTLDVFSQVLKRDSCCLDIGAHRGSILKHMLRIAPRGVHHAFEPLPYLAERIRRKYPTAKLHEVAVSDKAGRASFCFVENAPAWSGLRIREYEVAEPVITRLEVAVARVDDLVPTNLPVTLIKLDIEGGEYHALVGASETIRRCHPYIVFEAGASSTGKYDVTPEDLFALITEQFDLKLSTMLRWMNHQSPYKLAEFQENWHSGNEFYFLAYPRN